MSSFLKSHTPVNLAHKLLLLYLLNLSDILFTWLLIRSGYFLEGNPVMASLLQNSMTGIPVKIALPAALLLFIGSRIRMASEPQQKKANVYILAIVAFYVAVNLLHVVWFSCLAFAL